MPQMRRARTLPAVTAPATRTDVELRGCSHVFQRLEHSRLSSAVLSAARPRRASRQRMPGDSTSRTCTPAGTCPFRLPRARLTRGRRAVRARAEWHGAAPRTPARGQVGVRRDRRAAATCAMRRPCSRSAKPSARNSTRSACPPARIRARPEPGRSRGVHDRGQRRSAFRTRYALGDRPGRAVPGQADATQASRCAGPRVRAARSRRMRTLVIAGNDMGASRRSRAEVRARGHRGRATLHRPAARRRAARGAGRRRRRRLSVVGRGLRSRPARGAARRHAGGRVAAIQDAARSSRRPAAASSCRVDDDCGAAMRRSIDTGGAARVARSAQAAAGRGARRVSAATSLPRGWMPSTTSSSPTAQPH